MSVLLSVCRSDPGRPAAYLDGHARRQRLAIEAEYLELILHHALDEQRLAVLAPGGALTPMADIAFCCVSLVNRWSGQSMEIPSSLRQMADELGLQVRA